MIRAASLSSVAVAALVACTTIAEPPATQATVDQHVADARRIAGEDLKFLMPVCDPQPAVRAAPSPANDERLAKLINQPAPEPGQAFDNLYYVGSAWVSAWVLKTSDGLILIDALNNTKEAAELVEGGMRRLGLDPAQIRYVLVTHGHGDHYGGAQMLAERYRARVVASEIDWKMMETGLEFDSKMWDRPPKRDMAVKDGDTLKLGDTTVRFMITPGHTLGTISPVFDVRDGGQAHKALIWGGTSFNFGRDMGRLDSYIAQTERMRQLSAQWGIDVALSNHPGFDGTVAKLKARTTAPKGTNPFVSGQPVVDRAMRVLNTCARAQKARFLIAAAAGAGGAYASADGAVRQALHQEDDVHVAGAGLAHDERADAVPVVFPYSAHADDAACMH
ncbi:MAG TPA: MBL fold metallo-hydrolase [Burkholderiaceae bacterium]|nr:MBL fold metallo-hydrolase [Burkholderiaceae bacterium]